MSTPLNKKHCEHALALLEKIHEGLQPSSDERSRDALGKVIKVFQGELFGALIDIHVYYDEILREVHKSPDKVNREAVILAKKWEHENK